MLKEIILSTYPNITEQQLKLAIKYQEKFSLSIENLKCLNPNCKEVKKWFNTRWGFGHTCGNKECKDQTKNQVIQIGLEKGKQTYLKRTGYEHNSQNPETKIKTQATYQSKTGYTNPALNPEVKQKKKNTCLEKYGTNHPSQNPDTRIKAKETNSIRYGNSHYKNQHLTNFHNWYNKDFWIENFMVDGFFDNQKCMEYFNCTKNTVNTKIIELDILRKKIKGVSKAENEINDFIRTILITNIIRNSQSIIKPVELDIYIPDHNLAIEYNGIYWHSYMQQSNNQVNKQTDIRYCKQRHLQKTEACQVQGIKLFHIFENEWLNPVKQEIWKSVLENALGKSIRLGARKCILKPVPKKDIRPFLEGNHLQGYGVSPIAYGLYYDDQLMSIMTFASGKGRMDKNADWELIRFCNRIGYNVQGAASRLLKAFRAEHPGSIKSYANRRWSDGNLYRKLGFKETGISEPNHFYWHMSNHKVLYPRQTFQKHKLKEILSTFDSNLTAFDNMINNNYAMIWDSGNYTFILA